MVGFAGFLILAVAGGGLALFFGVPPIWIGGYVIGLILLGALTGFSTGSNNNRNGGGAGSGGSGSSGSGGFLSNAANAANGLMDGLSGRNNPERENIIENTQERTSSHYPNELQERIINNPQTPSIEPEDNVHNIDHTTGTNDEDYINNQNGDKDMSDAPVQSIEAEIERVINELGEEEQREQQEVQELDDARKNLISGLKELKEHEELEKFIIAINKEGLKGKSSAQQGKIVQKYARDYLGTDLDLEKIHQEVEIIADIEQKFERASKEMQDVERKEEEDVRETNQAEKELAEVARHLDHLLDASKELQHYFGQ